MLCKHHHNQCWPTLLMLCKHHHNQCWPTLLMLCKHHHNQCWPTLLMLCKHHHNQCWPTLLMLCTTPSQSVLTYTTNAVYSQWHNLHQCGVSHQHYHLHQERQVIKHMQTISIFININTIIYITIISIRNSRCSNTCRPSASSSTLIPLSTLPWSPSGIVGAQTHADHQRHHQH